MSAEQTVRIEGVVATGGSIPVAISGTIPPGSVIPVAQAAPAKSSAPTQANVLAGSVSDPSPIISLISGEIWYGFLQLSATLVGTSKVALITLNTNNGSAVPAPDVDLITLNLATGAAAATDAVTATARTNYMYIYANADTDIACNITGDPATVSATAYGYRLA